MALPRYPEEKRAFIKMIEYARAHFDMIVQSVPDDSVPGQDQRDDGAINEALALISFWESHLLDVVKRARAGLNPLPLGYPGEPYEAAVQRHNSEASRQARTRSPDDIRTQYYNGFMDLIFELEKLTEDDLFSPHTRGRYFGRPLAAVIADYTIYLYHAQGIAIDAWLNQKTATIVRIDDARHRRTRRRPPSGS